MLNMILTSVCTFSATLARLYVKQAWDPTSLPFVLTEHVLKQK